MSSEKTPKLNMHKWKPTDYVQMSEFNDNFGKIDTEIGNVTTALADTTNKLTFISLTEVGGLSDGVSDETALVQSTLNSLTPPAILKIPINTKWDYNLIVHPFDITIVDESTYDWDFKMWTGKFKEIVNASSPETKNANENIFMAPYHPAEIVDIRNDVGKASFIARRNGVARWQLALMNYGADDILNLVDNFASIDKQLMQVYLGDTNNQEMSFNRTVSKLVSYNFSSRVDGDNLVRFRSKNEDNNTVFQVFAGDLLEKWRIIFDATTNDITFNSRITGKSIVMSAEGFIKENGRLVEGNPKDVESVRFFGEDVYDTTNKMWHKSIGTFGVTGWTALQPVIMGTSVDRPTNPPRGFHYTDVTINKIIWWNGVAWRDAMGGIV